MAWILGLLGLLLGYVWGQLAQRKKQRLELKQEQVWAEVQTEAQNSQWAWLWADLAELYAMWQAQKLAPETWTRLLQRVFEQDLPQKGLPSWLENQPQTQHSQQRQRLASLVQDDPLQQALQAELSAVEPLVAEPRPEAAAEAVTSQFALGNELAEGTPPNTPEAASFLAQTPPAQDVLSQLLNLLDVLTTGRWGQMLIGLGVISVVVSALPLLQEMNSASLIYAVMLLYTLGLLGAGLGLSRRIPWTGQVLTLVSLMILPLDYASTLGLDLAVSLNQGLQMLAMLGLPLVAWLGLRSLLGKIDMVLILSLAGLGWASSLLRGVQDLMVQALWSADAFALLCVGVASLLVCLGSARVLNQLWVLPAASSDSHQAPGPHHNWLGSFGLLAYLLFSALMLPAIYALNCPWIGLMVLLGAGVSAWSALSLRRLLALHGADMPTSEHGQRWIIALDLLACGAVLLAAALAWTQPQLLAVICALGALLSLWLSASWQQTPWRWAFYGYAALLILGAVLCWTPDWGSDGQSLLLAGLAATCILWSLTGPATSWRQQALHPLALLLSAGAWLQLAQFRDWSLQSLVTLGLLGLIYLRYAVFSQRNLFGYVGITVLSLSALTLLAVTRPELAFADYRFYALWLAWLLLAVGWGIQRLSTEREALAEVHSGLDPTQPVWQQLNTDRFHPFHFQRRFVQPYPYLFSEPLYNLALLFTTVTLLSDLDSLGLTLLGIALYAAIFWIYPARLWIYLVVLAVSDSLLDLSTEMLPARYQSWTLVMLGLGWFFVGTLIEEILEARDRHRPDAHHEQQKKFARPFFHGAILSNVLLLRYFFGDLQNIFSEAGWLKITRETTPMMLTSVFYVLKMRVYVSKLWLYPGIITATLGLYFGLTNLLPVESQLLILSLISLFWLGLSRYLEAHKGLQAWWQELIAHRLPDLDPDSRFAQVHTHQLSSPLWTFGLISACCSLLFSSLLIPYQPLGLAALFEIALLQRSDPGTLYLLQAVNFVLLAVFFARAQPTGQRLLWLQGMVMLSLSLLACWLVQELARPTQLSLILAGLSLNWTLLWHAFASKCSAEQQRVLALGTLVLSGMTLAALAWVVSPELQVVSLGLLLLTWLLRLRLTQHPWQLYALSGAFVLAAELWWGQGLLAPMLLSPLLIWLWRQAQRHQTPFVGHFYYLNAGLCCLHLWGLFESYGFLGTGSPAAAFVGWQVLLGSWGGLWGLGLVWLSPHRFWLWGLLGYGALLAGMLMHVSLHSLWLLVASPWCLQALYQRQGRRALQIGAWLAPICLAFWIFAFSPSIYAGWGSWWAWKNLPFLAWLLFYFQTGQGQPAHSRYWLLAAAWLNFSGIYLLGSTLVALEHSPITLPHMLQVGIWQLIFLLPALTGLVLAYRVVLTQPNRDQLFYLSQTLLLSVPLLSYVFQLEQTDSFGYLLRSVFLLELLLGLLALAAFRFRLRALLKMVLLVLALLSVFGTGYIFWVGHWSLRWVLLIGAGLLLILGGNVLQAQREELRLRLERLQQELLSWS